MNFCNSHIMSMTVVANSNEGLHCVYWDHPKFCRCLNCGGDGNVHSPEGECPKHGQLYVHTPSFQEFAHAYFNKFFESSIVEDRKFKDELL